MSVEGLRRRRRPRPRPRRRRGGGNVDGPSSPYDFVPDKVSAADANDYEPDMYSEGDGGGSVDECSSYDEDGTTLTSEELPPRAARRAARRGGSVPNIASAGGGDDGGPGNDWAVAPKMKRVNTAQFPLNESGGDRNAEAGPWGGRSDASDMAAMAAAAAAEAKGPIIPSSMVPVEELDLAYRKAAMLSVGTWATMAVLVVTLTPADSWRTPTESAGRLAEGAACLVMATSVATKMMYMLLGGLENDGDGGLLGIGDRAAAVGGSRIQGAAIAGFSVQIIAAVTNGAMALLPSPVRTDAVTGVEVNLLRWCEWTPCAAIMGFITMSMDASDEPGCPGTFGVRGLKGAVLFGLSQGASTFCGIIFPLLGDRYFLWGLTMIVAITLHAPMHPSLLKKLERAKRLKRYLNQKRSRNADEMERSERIRAASQLMVLITGAWTTLIAFHFVSWIFHVSPDTNAVLECSVEVLSKHYYLSFLIDANARVFCTRRRTEWRLAEIKDHMMTIASSGGQSGDSAVGSMRRRYSVETDYDDYSSDDDSSLGSSVGPISIASRLRQGRGIDLSTDLASAAGDLANEAATNLANKISSYTDISYERRHGSVDGTIESRASSIERNIPRTLTSGSATKAGGVRREQRRRRSTAGTTSLPDLDRMKRRARIHWSRSDEYAGGTVGDPSDAGEPFTPIRRESRSVVSLTELQRQMESMEDDQEASELAKKYGLPPPSGPRRRGSGVDSVCSGVSALSMDYTRTKEYQQSVGKMSSQKSESSDDDAEGNMEDTIRNARVNCRGSPLHGSMTSINSMTRRLSDNIGGDDASITPDRGSEDVRKGKGKGGGYILTGSGTDDVLDALQGLIYDMKGTNPHNPTGSDSVSRSSGGGRRKRRGSMSMVREVPSVAPPPIPNVVGTTSGRVRPETLHDVTVLFSDVVGFTSLCSKLSVEEVGDLIERLFTEFDRLADRHGVTKIDVVGDAFFGLCGIPDRDGHAAKAAIFSLEAIRASNQMLACPSRPELGHLSVRMGLASGSVVASMIGSGNHLKYTLFGDVVNTASRMESTSLPDKVQCTKETAELIRVQAPAIDVERRGEIEVKGKGMLETFFVNAPKKGFSWDKYGGFII